MRSRPGPALPAAAVLTPAASGASRYIPELARLFNKSPSTVGGTLALLNATFVLASPFVPKVVARLGEDRVSAVRRSYRCRF